MWGVWSGKFNVLVSFMFYGVLSDLFPLKHFGSRTSILFCVLHAVSFLKKQNKQDQHVRQTGHWRHPTLNSYLFAFAVTVWVNLFKCFSWIFQSLTRPEHPGVARACHAGFASSEPGVDRDFCVTFQIRVVHTHSFIFVRPKFRGKNLAQGHLAF